ncbi:MAG TPA: tetratricopeptide repeat protein [Gemmataceae bacterium]|nr:tetratricopeptide repeat protein [Gemmataceae bacterium]
MRPLHSLFGSARRHPVRAAAVALALALAAAGAAVYGWGSYHLRAAARDLREERFDDARGHVRSCLRVWPYSARAHLLAARIERQSDNFPEAERHLNECKRLQGGATDEVQLEWLLMRAQSGEVDELADGLWRYVEEDRAEAPSVLEVLAQSYIRRMRYHSALTCLDEWLKREPDNARALDWRGWVRERLHKLDEAAADYQHALAVAPQRWEVRLRLADLLLLDSKPQEALLQLERLRQDGVDRPAVLVALARGYAALGRPEEARAALEKALAADPDNAPALIALGKLENQSQRPAEAEKHLRRALALTPFDQDAHFTLYQALEAQSDRREEAAAQLARYKALEADAKRLTTLVETRGEQAAQDPNTASEIGSLLLRIGLQDQGLYWLNLALEKDRQNRRAHAALADYYQKHNQPEKAAEHRRALADPAPQP